MGNQKSKLGSQRGMTLIEILITMVVVSIVFIGLILGNAVIQKSAEAAFERTRAIQDAHRVMESIRKTAKTGNFPSNVTGVYPNAGTVSGFTALKNQSVVVSYTDGNGDGIATNDNPLDVTVTVTWLENGVRSMNKSIRSMVTQS